MSEAKSGVVDITNEYKLLPTLGEYNADITYNNIRYSAKIEISGRRVLLPDKVNGKVIIEL